MAKCKEQVHVQTQILFIISLNITYKITWANTSMQES